MSEAGNVQLLNRSLLDQHPLPTIDSGDDKESRGRVLIIGGSTRVPGALLLAGVAALRAGAGKLQLATVQETAIPLGIAVPESLVVALPSTKDGEIDGKRVMKRLRSYVENTDALLIGPGMLEEDSAAALMESVLPILSATTRVILDGEAAVALRRAPQVLDTMSNRVAITPHAGEMASLLDIDKKVVESDPGAMALQASQMLCVTVALKGAETWIATPEGELFHFRGGTSGLGTSGSGDTLAGVIAGLAARGAPIAVATLWGVWAHGTAGEQLSRRMAPVGFLARELLAELPPLVGR